MNHRLISRNNSNLSIEMSESSIVVGEDSGEDCISKRTISSKISTKSLLDENGGVEKPKLIPSAEVTDTIQEDESPVARSGSSLDVNGYMNFMN